MSEELLDKAEKRGWGVRGNRVVLFGRREDLGGEFALKTK